MASVVGITGVECLVESVSTVANANQAIDNEWRVEGAVANVITTSVQSRPNAFGRLVVGT